MNVLLFNLRTDSADTALGFTTAWINALAQHCDRIDVVTMYAGDVDVAANVRVHSLGKEKGFSEARRLVRFYRIVLATLRQERIDVVFAHMAPLFAVLFAPVAKLRRIPVLLWYAHKSVPRMLRLAHVLVDRCVSSTPEGFRLESRKVSFIGQGVDTNLFVPPSKPTLRYETTALAIGRVTPVKNLEEILEAVALIRETESEVRLRVVGGPLTEGDVPYEQRVREAAERVGAGVVEFTGPVPFTRVADEYRYGGLFVNLSESGSLDKAILEGMSSGCIPICRNDAFRTLAREHGLLELVPEAGAASVAECVQRVMRMTDAEKEALRQRLRAIVVAQHSLEALAREVATQLRALVRPGSTQPLMVLDNRSPGDRAAAAARSNILVYPLIAAIGWAATIAVARVLSLDDFALYAVALALRGTIQFLADLGTGAASARIFAELKELGARRQAWRLYYRLLSGRGVLVLIFVVAIAVAPDTFGSWLGLRGDETDFLAFVAAIGAAEVVALLGYYVLSGTLSLGAANRVTLAQTVLQPTFVLAAAWLGLGLTGILFALVLGSVVRAVGWNVAAVRALRSLPDSDAELERLGHTYSRVAFSSIAGKAAGWIHSRQLASIVALSSSNRSDLATFAVGYDFVHQAAQFASTPTSGIVLPSFSVVERTTASLRQRFDQATRVIALLLFPIMTVLVAVSPSLVPVAFGEEYDDAVLYVLLMAPALAVELVLLIPATGLMLSQTELLRSYLGVKLASVALGLLYFVLPGVSLVLVAVFMMLVRLASAGALHVAIFRRTRIHAHAPWLARSIGIALASGIVGAAALLAVPGTVADLVVVPVACLATYAVLVRTVRILLPEDAALILRVVPAARRGLDLLATSR